MASIRTFTQTQKLFFDFRWKGHRCREYTSLDDTPANRKKLEKIKVDPIVKTESCRV